MSEAFDQLAADNPGLQPVGAEERRIADLQLVAEKRLDGRERLVADENRSDSVEEPIVTNEEQSAGEKSEQIKVRRADRAQTISHMLWLLAALILPAVLVFLTSHDDEIATTIFRSLRLGLTSCFVALAILGLSQIDRNVLGIRMDSRSQAIAGLLGVMLWIVWVGSGQMVFKAADEARAGALVDQGS